jgi:hypoxanthine phosphoribosyltransferase
VSDPGQLPERRLRELHSAGEVRERIGELAAELVADYPDTLPVFIAIAEGALRFSDLLATALASRGRAPEVRIVRARRTRGTELGDVAVESFDGTGLEDRDVLVLDDVADEGRTLEAVLARVDEAKVRSARIAVLVSKRERRRVHVPLDYVGFVVDRGWVVGVGMDLDGAYRELDALAVLES